MRLSHKHRSVPSHKTPRHVTSFSIIYIEVTANILSCLGTTAIHISKGDIYISLRHLFFLCYLVSPYKFLSDSLPYAHLKKSGLGYKAIEP